MRIAALRIPLTLTACAILLAAASCGRSEGQGTNDDPSAAPRAEHAGVPVAAVAESESPARAAEPVATSAAEAARAAASDEAPGEARRSVPPSEPTASAGTPHEATRPEPTPPAPEPPPAGPWDEAACLPATVDGPTTVLCRDQAAALAWAKEHGDPLPALGRSSGKRADPTPPTDGLTIHRSTRRRIAPMAKFTPILFYETPPFSDAQWAWFAENPARWKQAKEYWATPKKQVTAYKRLRRQLKDSDKEALRNIILRNGYLYTEDRRLGRRIYKTVRLTHLFDEEEIWLQRGDVVHRLKRDRRRGYEHADGPLEGRKAVILLFDRIATSPEAFATTYHWDLQAVRHGLGLYTIDIEETKAPTLAFRSTFLSGEPIEGVLFHDEGRTAVAVAGIDPTDWAAVYTDNRRRFRAREKILDAAEAFADEWIRFDEPDIEFGQEDGKLRDAWTEAYFDGKDRYEYNGVEYRVFSGRGTPIPPQVCVDFLMDSIERASGNWWAPRTRSKEDRRRTKGTVNWRDFDGLAARSIPRVSRFAKAHPEMFEVYEVPESGQVKFETGNRFFNNIEKFPVDFREADMIIIYGYREDEKRHYHSFFVHAIDPIDGFPIILSDNAGLAAVRVWYDVMKTAPQRYIHRRIRLLDSWLLELGMGDG